MKCEENTRSGLKIIPHDLYLAHDVSIGASLVDTLDEFINDGHIEPQLAMKILGHFDRLTAEVLGEKVKARMTFKASLDTYRFCDEVWTFQLKDVNFKLDGNSPLQTEKLKIVAMGTKKVDEK